MSGDVPIRNALFIDQSNLKIEIDFDQPEEEFCCRKFISLTNISDQYCNETTDSLYRNDRVQSGSKTVSLAIAFIGLFIAIYYFTVLAIYALRFGEFSPFKTILRKFSYGILLTCSLLDIMLCSFTLWANLTEEVTPLSCRLTEKISNIIFVTSFYFIYLFLWLRQMKFYQDPLLKDNYPQWCLKLNKFTLGCIIGVVTASEFSVAVPWFDPIITICGRPFSIGNLNILNGICYQDDDEWSLWLGLSGMLVIQGRLNHLKVISMSFANDLKNDLF